MSITLGVDPGNYGGLVILDNNGKIIDKIITPITKNKNKSGKTKTNYDIEAILRFIRFYKITHAGLEFSQSFPGQGSCSNHTTGVGYGIYLGIIASLGVPYVLPRPREWQKNVLAGYDKSDTKRASLMFCHRTWPLENWKATERCKKAHDGLTDAACITWYTWQHFKN